jgi:hypothetical protein
MPNVDRLFNALMRITLFSESWNQEQWLGFKHLATSDVERFPHAQKVPIINCQTSHCLFGQGCLDAGLIFVADPGDDVASDVIEAADLPALLDGTLDDWCILPASEGGAKWFEVDYDDATALSYGKNTLLDLWAISYCITDGKMALPSSLPAAGGEQAVPDLKAAIDAWINTNHARRVVMGYSHRQAFVNGTPCECAPCKARPA